MSLNHSCLTEQFYLGSIHFLAGLSLHVFSYDNRSSDHDYYSENIVHEGQFSETMKHNPSSDH